MTVKPIIMLFRGSVNRREGNGDRKPLPPTAARGMRTHAPGCAARHPCAEAMTDEVPKMKEKRTPSGVRFSIPYSGSYVAINSLSDFFRFDSRTVSQKGGKLRPFFPVLSGLFRRRDYLFWVYFYYTTKTEKSQDRILSFVKQKQQIK